MTAGDGDRHDPHAGSTCSAGGRSRGCWWRPPGYVACSILANVMSVRILRIGPDWASFSIDAGTLTYPLTFTLRDLVHKVGGRHVARVVILSTAALNVVAAVALWATAALPGDAAVLAPAQEWFGPVLNPVLRITAASVIAQVVAELLDTEVYHRFVLRFGHRQQWGRVLASNAVSIPVDSIVFVAIAFGGVVPVRRGGLDRLGEHRGQGPDVGADGAADLRRARGPHPPTRGLNAVGPGDRVRDANTPPSVATGAWGRLVRPQGPGAVSSSGVAAHVRLAAVVGLLPTHGSLLLGGALRHSGRGYRRTGGRLQTGWRRSGGRCGVEQLPAAWWWSTSCGWSCAGTRGCP